MEKYMFYKSTRSREIAKYSSAQVIKQGLAEDGGLFVPESIPTITSMDIEKICSMSYVERAAYVLSLFLTDYTYGELIQDCRDAYNEISFPGGPAPLVKLGDSNIYSLELWHGPTAAFKDMALQIMPRLLSRALVKTGEERTALILVATSGDTGKAALEGYKDVDRTRITVFYPVDGVSRVQKLQMATQTGENVDVCAIKGNFDDAQNGVKQIFADTKMSELLNSKNFFFSSANSINWGRLAPQIVYYISAYCDLVNDSKIKNGEKINICVPTGNFGNILAAYIAKLMGLPFEKLICASNSNNVLTEFLRTGIYDRNRDFHVTMSPSMDILISSNLERLLYLIAGPEKTAKYMEDLKNNGKYSVTPDILSKISETFVGYFASESGTAKTIRTIYKNHLYLSDTHTAVAFNCAEQYLVETSDNKTIVVASTASPYKFAGDVYKSLTEKDPSGNLEALEELNLLTNVEIPLPLRNIGTRKVRFEKTIEKDYMKDYVKNSL